MSRPPNKWVYYSKGTRVGEWSTIEFPGKDEAVAFAKLHSRDTGLGVTVREIPFHHTLSHEVVRVTANGDYASETVTTI
jgi:hypothetical protein